MTSVVNVCNLALLEMGNRVQINSLNDNSPAGNAASLFYTPKTKALLRGAPWTFCRKQVLLTQYKASIVNGAQSSDPPPQPWNYEYLRPADCLRARFLIPFQTITSSGVPLTTAPNEVFPTACVNTGIPFVDAMDVDTNGNPIAVILTQLPQAQLVYTADLSQFPDMWDDMFLAAETAYLASYFINALAGDRAAMGLQIQIAKAMLDSARAVNASESITSMDHVPDWMRARSAGGFSTPWAPGFNNALGSFVSWDACAFPNGLSY